jgi:hypothetical protein
MPPDSEHRPREQHRKRVSTACAVLVLISCHPPPAPVGAASSNEAPRLDASASEETDVSKVLDESGATESVVPSSRMGAVSDLNPPIPGGRCAKGEELLLDIHGPVCVHHPKLDPGPPRDGSAATPVPPTEP